MDSSAVGVEILEQNRRVSGSKLGESSAEMVVGRQQMANTTSET